MWTFKKEGTEMIVNYFRGDESSLRSLQSLSYSRISQHFMELEDSQELPTGPCPEPHESRRCHI
jgi:hypothetical protein